MAQTQLLIDTLKRNLKAQGRTYRDVGRALNLSETSVKRLFAHKTLSLVRLDKICQMLGIEISDLVSMMDGKNQQTEALSVEQEQQIADDELLLLVAVCVLNKMSFVEILEHYALKDTELIQKLAQLDRARIIELQANNRIKLLISSNFKWLENGPIQTYFLEKVEAAFFASRFDQEFEKLISISGLVSLSSNALFQRKMERLAAEFAELQRDDERLPLVDRHGTTIVLAIRQWQYGLFQQWKRSDG